MPRYSMAKLARQRFDARNMLKALAKERKAAVRDIVGRYNHAEFVALRVEFIKRAAAHGLGSVTIGRIIQRHNTTVLYHMSGWKERKRHWRETRRDREAQHVA